MNPVDGRELVEDGRSVARRDAFRRAEAVALQTVPRPTLDHYLALLESFQALFGPVPVSREPTVGRRYRL